MNLTNIVRGVLLVAGAVAATGVPAEPTRITVRVLAADAKFIGESMGSAWITLTDAGTGKVLAGGPTLGKTGDTDLIMKTPRARGGTLSSEDSAAWSATLDLDRPTRIRATATGPLAPASAAGSVSATRWIIPGRHLDTGDAWLLDMPGLAVELHGTPPVSGPGPMTVSARVRMMCGCPLESGGLWNADEYEVRAQLWSEDSLLVDSPLRHSGVTSEFAGSIDLPDGGPYELLVFAYHPDTGNAGVDTLTLGTD